MSTRPEGEDVLSHPGQPTRAWLGASDVLNTAVRWWDEDARRAREAPRPARDHEGLLRRARAACQDHVLLLA